jgi:hypothetical protein
MGPCAFDKLAYFWFGTLDLKDILGELPKREASHFRSQVICWCNFKSRLSLHIMRLRFSRVNPLNDIMKDTISIFLNTHNME